MTENISIVRLLSLTLSGNPVSVVERQVTAPSKLKKIIFIGGVHGDEPEGVELATHLVTWMKTAKVNFDWKIIPCLNPDGFFAHPKQRTNGRAVDLNRNFPSQDWSKASQAPRYFPGTGPASEKETRALTDLIVGWKPNLIIHFHSYSDPCIVYTGKRGQAVSEMFARISGYPAKPDIGYPTPGSLGQFGALDLDTPVICIEEKEGVDLKTIWPRFVNAFEELAVNDALIP